MLLNVVVVKLLLMKMLKKTKCYNLVMLKKQHENDYVELIWKDNLLKIQIDGKQRLKQKLN